MKTGVDACARSTHSAGKRVQRGDCVVTILQTSIGAHRGAAVRCSRAFFLNLLFVHARDAHKLQKKAILIRNGRTQESD